MPDEDLLFASARSLAAAVRAREVSPVELLEATLRRADVLNPKLNALVWRNDEEARTKAREAESKVIKGESLPPFHGVPLPIKDLTPVKGWPVSYGSSAVPAAPAGHSELVVEAFERAGFVLTGLTNTPEFGLLTVSENLRHGVTRNPWDLDRTAGGSSGGAAAVVAAGIFSAAHGNDGGGSLRIPASCCGLVGLKPSRGRVPTLYMSWEGATVTGALTRDVADAAAILDVICGPDPLQWYNAPAPDRPFSAEVGAPPGELTVGVVEEAPLGLPVDQTCVDAVRKAAAALESAGHHLEATTLRIPDEFVEAFFNVHNTGLADHEDVDWDKAEPHVRADRASALAVDSLRYVRSVHLMQRLSRPLVGRWGHDFDILLTPTMAIGPPLAGEVLKAAHETAGGLVTPVFLMAVFASGFNVTGQPAISLPVHRSEGGLPIGVQLVGGPWQEAVVLRVAAQLEEALPWAAVRPSI